MSYLGLHEEPMRSALLGEHSLTGVDFSGRRSGNGIRFILDGVTYEVTEDECDGYRSSANPMVVTDYPITNVFPAVKVIGSEDADDEILVLRDAETQLEVIRVGTGDAWDYYPYFISEFNPQNMAINKEK